MTAPEGFIHKWCRLRWCRSFHRDPFWVTQVGKEATEYKSSTYSARRSMNISFMFFLPNTVRVIISELGKHTYLTITPSTKWLFPNLAYTYMHYNLPKRHSEYQINWVHLWKYRLLIWRSHKNPSWRWSKTFRSDVYIWTLTWLHGYVAISDVLWSEIQ